MTSRLSVLILDDWQGRHDRIQDVLDTLPGVEITYQRRYAPEQVQPTDWHWADVVFLDHDMCLGPLKVGSLSAPCPSTGVALSGCACPTGFDAVQALIRSGARPQCIIHSANPAGAQRMQFVLLDHQYDVHVAPISSWSTVAPSALFRKWGLYR